MASNSSSKPFPGELLEAARTGNTEAVRDLLKRGARADEVDSGSTTALILAAQTGHTEVARLLLDNGADIDAYNVYGNNALILAAGYGYKEIVRLLIERGAILDHKDRLDRTALIYAAERNHIEIVQMLRDAPETRRRIAAERAKAEEQKNRDIAANLERQHLTAALRQQRLKEVADRSKLKIRPSSP